MTKIVMVTWFDAHGGTRNGWRDIKDVVTVEPVIAVSVGYLMSDTKRRVVIVPHAFLDKDGKLEQGDGEIAIPKSWVKEIKVLSDD
jgi:hypothetical protein